VLKVWSGRFPHQRRITALKQHLKLSKGLLPVANDSETKRKNLRTAVLLVLLAVGFYAAFIFAQAMRAG
jgi:hypothetical protein